MFDSPIPGQSLTKEPKNYAWENPPEMVDVDDVIGFHLNKLSEEKSIDNLLLLLESGMPVKTLVETFLTSAVMSGLHTVDVSILVAPVLHEFITMTAEDAEINFKEFFSSDEIEEGNLDSKVNLLLKKSLSETADSEKDSGYKIVKEMSKAAKEQPLTEEIQKEKSKGLMSRENTDV